MEVVPIQKNVYLEKIIDLSAMKKEIYVRNVKMIISQIKMEDVHILIIVRYLKGEYVFNAAKILS